MDMLGVSRTMFTGPKRVLERDGEIEREWMVQIMNSKIYVAQN